jgi:hypothetical protein
MWTDGNRLYSYHMVLELYNEERKPFSCIQFLPFPQAVTLTPLQTSLGI